jgi:hypothetical protein
VYFSDYPYQNHPRLATDITLQRHIQIAIGL